MFTQRASQTLTRRGSKLLVELVIGIVGILGIMLAKVSEPNAINVFYLLQHGGEIISTEANTTNVQIDWLNILF